MRRATIVGASGSGTSRLATALAEKIDGTSLELDELFHDKNSAPTPDFSVTESRRRSTSRVIRCSLWRLITREELWNGNRQRWRNLFRCDLEVNIIVWA